MMAAMRSLIWIHLVSPSSVVSLIGHGLEMRRARVEHLVDAMADAHDFFPLGELLSTQASTLSGEPISSSMWMTASLAPPWSGPLSEPMAEVMAEYMSDKVEAVTRAEKVRGVEAVVGVEDIGHVERLDRFRAGSFAVDEVEKMGGFVEVLADGRKRFALPCAMEIGDDDADFGGDRNGAGQKLVGRLRADRRVVVKAEHRDAGAQDVHDVCGLGRIRDIR